MCVCVCVCIIKCQWVGKRATGVTLDAPIFNTAQVAILYLNPQKK